MKRNCFFLIFSLILLFSCGKGSNLSTWDDASVVAERSIINGDTVITCFFDQLRDTVNFPLSRIIEDLQVIQLEDSDTALVSRYHTFASENYIGIFTEQHQYKLFDKTGKFISQIGRKGQGPGEYASSIYDSQIDEANNCIYLMPWNQKKILVYNLAGDLLPDIPLYEMPPKAKFRIDSEHQTVQIGILPFPEGNNFVVWTQKFNGEIIDSVSSKPYIPEYIDFSSEVFSNRNITIFDYYLMIYGPVRQDTLYHYIQGEQGRGRLMPIYTIDFRRKDPILLWHIELPYHFITIIGEQEKINEFGQFYRPVATQFIVDKYY